MKVKAVLALTTAAAMGIALSGCGSSDEGAGGTTIEWWHIQTQEPTRGVWQSLADEFETQNPGVQVEITVQNDPEFKTGLDARAQAGDMPSLFQTWGGGTLANLVDAGLVQDLSATTETSDVLSSGAVEALQVEGTQYALPYDSGVVGFWYNKALFEQAGVTELPQTWDELVTVVGALRDSGVVPIALGAGDKWPAMFYWAEGALALGGVEPLAEAGETGAFDGPAFVGAGERIGELVAADAFQDGYLGSAYAEAGGASSLVANGSAAMELMGGWAPGTQASVATEAEGLGDDLGWFPYPADAAGPDVAFGGVNGFAIGADAPPETVEFLEFLLTPDAQSQLGAAGQLLPVAEGSEGSIANPLQRAVRDRAAEVTTLQNFLDQAYAPAVATAINDNVQAIFAGTMTPEEASEAITQVAQQ